MVYNLSELESIQNQPYDICIVGSGPAGGTLASVLFGSRLRVCVLESGSFKPGRFSDALREVYSNGILIKDYSRERVVGGTSSTWAGLSSALDPIDFKKRKWVRYSGWPFLREELDPYYRKASQLFRFPPLELFEDKKWMNLNLEAGQFPEWKTLQEKIFVAPETPPDYAREQAHVYKGERIDLFTNATVTHLEGLGESGRASRAIACASDGRRFSFEAGVFVLAGGGIENPRILLNSTFAHGGGLGNDKDQVGRYFMNHPKNNFGLVKPVKEIGDAPGYFGFLSLQAGYAAYIGLRLREDLQEREHLLNSYVRFEPVFNWSGRESIRAFQFFVKQSRGLLKVAKAVKKNQVMPLRDYFETGDDSDMMNNRKTFPDIARMMGKIALDFPMVMHYVYNRFFDNRPLHIREIWLRNFMEMEPDPNNRVTLGSKRDVFGFPLPVVRHSPGELDKRSMAAVQQYLGRELAESGLGRLITGLSATTNPWPVDYDASHHMGATRMGCDPATSVTDGNGRLHFSENVYVSGASVFPTSGSSNPTYTIVALAIRLGEHLKSYAPKR